MKVLRQVIVNFNTIRCQTFSSFPESRIICTEVVKGNLFIWHLSVGCSCVCLSLAFLLLVTAVNLCNKSGKFSLGEMLLYYEDFSDKLFA